MKKKLKRLAVWYLKTYYPVTSDRISINTNNITVNFKGFVNDDTDWHQVQISASYYVKAASKDVLVDNVSIYDNGELSDYHNLEVASEVTAIKYE